MRRFLAFLLLTLAIRVAAAASPYPMPVPPTKNSAAWAEKNRATIEAARQGFAKAMSHGGPSVIRPEYERNLKEMAFSLRRDGHHSLADFGELFNALPAYSNLHIFVPVVAIDEAEDQLEDLGMGNRGIIYPVQSEFLSGRWRSWKDTFITNSDIWMRDIALVGAKDGNPTLYLPLAYNASRDIRHSDSNFIRDIVMDGHFLDIVPFPYFVRGGNVMVGEAEGRLVAFVGRHEVEFNAMVLPVLTSGAPDEKTIADGFLKAIQVVTGASKVVVLPNTRQVFHIDQAMTFLAPGRAAVLKSVDGVEFAGEERAMFEEIRRILGENGFSIADIPSSPGHLSRYESSVNAVPFRNALTGQRTLILPRFSDTQVYWGGKSFRSMMDLVADIYRREGYEVISIMDVFHNLQGNTHCVTLPLN